MDSENFEIENICPFFTIIGNSMPKKKNNGKKIPLLLFTKEINMR